MHMAVQQTVARRVTCSAGQDHFQDAAEEQADEDGGAEAVDAEAGQAHALLALPHHAIICQRSR